jgi:hypothetical protein
MDATGPPGAICFHDCCVCGFSIDIDGRIDAATVTEVKRLFEDRRAHEGADEEFTINSPGGSDLHFFEARHAGLPPTI